MTTVVRKFRCSLCASGRTSQIRKFYCQRGPESNCPNAQRRGRRKFLLRRNKKAGKSPITLEAPTPLGRGGIPPVPGVRYIRWPLPCLPHGLPRGIRKLGNPPSLKLPPMKLLLPGMGKKTNHPCLESPKIRTARPQPKKAVSHPATYEAFACFSSSALWGYRNSLSFRQLMGQG